MAVYQAKKEAGENPDKPIDPQILCQEPTTEALQRDLYMGRPSQGLFNDEGGQFLGGHSMKSEHQLKMITTLSKFWDGKRQVRNRAVEKMVLLNRRLSLHLMVQPGIANMLLTDQRMIEQGITARFLICQPKSLQGTRLYNGLDYRDSEAIALYHARVRELLETPYESYETSGLVLKTMEVADNSEPWKVWVEYYNEVETRLLTIYRNIGSAASKNAEQALRIAGVLSAFNGEDQISYGSMIGGCVIAQYYLNAQLEAEERASYRNEDNRVEALKTFLMLKTGKTVTSRDICRAKPRGTQIRSADALRSLMAHLEDDGFVAVKRADSRREPTAWLVLGGQND
jgi:hypothetical protein